MPKRVTFKFQKGKSVHLISTILYCKITAMEVHKQHSLTTPQCLIKKHKSKCNYKTVNSKRCKLHALRICKLVPQIPVLKYNIMKCRAILVEQYLHFISTSLQFENEMLSQTSANEINGEAVMPESALARENVLTEISNRI